MAKFKFDPNGDIDAGMGLIFRLNSLWRDVDSLAFEGRYIEWNFKLDRIFSNLLYKNPLDVEQDKEGNIISVDLAEQDKKIYDFVNKEVIEVKRRARLAKTPTEKKLAFNDLYEALLLKEYHLRKFMASLKLYIKQHDGNPAHAMWGG